MNTMTKLMIASLFIFYTGCSPSVTSSYSPISQPIYPETLHGNVKVDSIKDKRDMEPNEYYKSFVVGQSATYEKSISNIVREALVTEMDRAGVGVKKSANTSTSADSISIQVEVLEYLAQVTRPTLPFQSDELELKVSIRFRWVDASGKLLEDNERSEHTKRDLGVGLAPVAPFGNSVIRGYGEELMNSLLSRVIEKEILLNKVLK